MTKKVNRVFWMYRFKLDKLIEAGMFDARKEFRQVSEELAFHETHGHTFEANCLRKIREFLYVNFFNDVVGMTGKLRIMKEPSISYHEQREYFQIVDGEIITKTRSKVLR